MQGTKSLCVYCASTDHIPQMYIDTAEKLGRLLVSEGFRLVYGGGNNGLMGVIAEEVHTHGGHVTGVITRQFVDMGFACDVADEMIVQDTMRQRKAVMAQMSDAFIALPGGYGTLEELLEIITLKQLGVHEKPIVILNAGEFYQGLISQFETCGNQNFVNEKHQKIFMVTPSVEDAVTFVSKNIKKSKW